MLACEPMSPAFGRLKGSAAMMFPLVLAVGCLAPVIAVIRAPLTDACAVHGLKALQYASFEGRLDLRSNPIWNELSETSPLISWLTALTMQLFGSAADAGLYAASCLAAILLVLASFALGRRLGGDYLGVVAALMISVHPLMLHGARVPNPQSISLLLMVLAGVVIVGHWQKGSTLVSKRLLLAGAAFGLLIIGGGAVSLAAIVVFFLDGAVLNIAAEHQRRQERGGDRPQFMHRITLQSLVVVILLGLIVGGWQIALESSQQGAIFWQQWLEPFVAQHLRKAHSRWGFVDFWSELTGWSGPLLGLSVVGLATIVRDLTAAVDDPARRHRSLLLSWTIVGVFCWWKATRSADLDQSQILIWEAFLTAPLVFSAGIGWIEIAERRVPSLMAVLVFPLTLANLGVFAFFAEEGTNRSILGMNEWSLFQHPWAFMVVVVIVGWASARLIRRGDVNCRRALATSLGALALLHFWWGTLLPRAADSSLRELRELQASLAKISDVRQISFAGLTPRGDFSNSVPPARLVFAVARQCPHARIELARSWDEAVVPDQPSIDAQSAGTQLVVGWTPRGTIRTLPSEALLKLATPPILFDNLDVVVYLRDGNAAASQ